MPDLPSSLDDVIASVVAAVRQAHALGKHEMLVSIVQSAQAGLGGASIEATPKLAQPELSLGASAKRTRSGPVKSVVRAFIFGADRPVTEAEFAQEYPEINRSSRYMAFRALAEAGEITKSGDVWVPASKGVGNPDAAASGSERQAVEGLGGR